MKQRPWTMRAGLAVVVVAAAAGTGTAAVGGETCSPWGCGSNTPVLWGIPIIGLNLDGVPNADGVTLDRRLWRPEPGGLRDTGCVLEVRKGRLVAQTGAGRPCPTLVPSADPLIGLVFSVGVPRKKGCNQADSIVDVKLRVDASGTVPLWDLDANAADVPTYRLVWHDLSGARAVLAAQGEALALREGDAVCPMRDASWMEAWQTHTSEWQTTVTTLPPSRTQRPVPIAETSPWFAMTDHLLLMHGETYSKDSSIDAARRGGRWFNLACAGTAIAKLRLLGYEPLRAETGSGDERQATLKMITASYRGARSYTSGGVPVIWKHKSGKRIAGQPAPEVRRSSELLESHWGAAGAQCLSHRRTWFKEPLCVGCSVARPGDVWEALRAALPEASSHDRLSLGTLGGAFDYLGAEERSLQDVRRSGVPTCEGPPHGTAFWTTYVVRHAHL
jgi:hypothetical protein